MPRRVVPWLNVLGRRRLPMISQTTVAECGLACVAMIAGYFGSEEDLVSLRRRFGSSLRGATLGSLIRIGEALQLSARAVRCQLPELRRLRKPCVLHWEFDHFVVLRKLTGTHLHIHDPARGVQRLSFAEASAKFTGVALELAPTNEFRFGKLARRLNLHDLLVIDRNFVTSVSAALVLAMASEILFLATPFYLQTVIDHVVLRGDYALLNTLVLGFSVLVIFQLAAGGMRQLTFQFLSQTTVFSLSSRMMRHLLHLPVSWFRARRLGDIQQRVQSVARIQAFVTQSAPAIALDAVFLCIVIALMLSYAPVLTIIVAAACMAYLVWRVLLFPTVFEQASRLVRAEAAVQTHVLESLRAIQSIKMSDSEMRRTEEWQNHFVHRINTEIQAGNLGVLDRTIHQLLFQGLHIGVVYLLAKKVQAGEMSVGAISAFVAYAGMFVTRAGGIINRWIEYRLLRVPLDRLADVVFHKTEVDEHRGDTSGMSMASVRACDLTFAYAETDAPVLEGISFEAVRGELIAIRGRSGCGKSTLLRLLAGVEQPSSGTLLFDGKPATDWPRAAVRRSIATVFHDDALLSGSIAENIALFDGGRDDRRVHEAAERAVIDGTIAALPMAYDTPIGDLGSTLSAGQVQRILFARALYRRPSILLLDEFTSGLDGETERRVINSLVRLTATRIVVTHSLSVLRAADRILELRDGRLTLR